MCTQINMIPKEQSSGHKPNDEFERVYILLTHSNEVYKIPSLSARPYVGKLGFRRISGFHLDFDLFLSSPTHQGMQELKLPNQGLNPCPL